MASSSTKASSSSKATSSGAISDPYNSSEHLYSLVLRPDEHGSEDEGSNLESRESEDGNLVESQTDDGRMVVDDIDDGEEEKDDGEEEKDDGEEEKDDGEEEKTIWTIWMWMLKRKAHHPRRRHIERSRRALVSVTHLHGKQYSTTFTRLTKAL
jgi:hypothetical protein